METYPYNASGEIVFPKHVFVLGLNDTAEGECSCYSTCPSKTSEIAVFRPFFIRFAFLMTSFILKSNKRVGLCPAGGGGGARTRTLLF